MGTPVLGKDGAYYTDMEELKKANSKWEQQERLIKANKEQAKQAAEATKIAQEAAVAQAKALEDMAWQQKVAAVEAENRSIRAENERIEREYQEEQKRIQDEKISKLNNIGLSGKEWFELLENTYNNPPMTERLKDWRERGGHPSLEEWKEERKYNRNDYKNSHVDSRQEQYQYREFEVPRICSTFNKLIIISIIADMILGFGAIMNWLEPAPFASWCFPGLMISLILGIIIYSIKKPIHSTAYSKWKKEDKNRQENFDKIEDEIEKEQEKRTDLGYERYLKDFEDDYNTLEKYIENAKKFEENRIKEWNQELENVLEEIGYSLKYQEYPEESTQGKKNNKNDDLMKKYGLKKEE